MVDAMPGKIRRFSDIPIVMVTGQNRRDRRLRFGLEIGADDYIRKPTARAKSWPA